MTLAFRYTKESWLGHTSHPIVYLAGNDFIVERVE